MFARLRQLLARWKRQLFHKGLADDFDDYFGPDFDRLSTHEKHFPGYDLASVHLALSSLFADHSDDVRHLGAVYVPNLRDLFLRIRQGKWKTHTPPYQRIPVDVDQEESFPTNGLSFCILRPEAGRDRSRPTARVGATAAEGPAAAPEKIAVLAAAANYSYDYYEGMQTAHAPNQPVCISIACRSRAVADRFFWEVEQRRKRLSVYRGKVIDPVVGPGGVRTIGFKAIQKVKLDDLVLSDEVKGLLDGAILRFYQHRETLEQMGIDLKRGILLHGPPGTGKTSISLYLANHLPHFTVCFVSGERLLYPRELCQMARYLQPAMIVFEDIDLVAHERQVNGLATVLGELMNQIDGCEPRDQVLFLMNTNSLERLEHAVKNRPGRVDQIIHVPLPSKEQRRKLLEHFTRNITLAGDVDEVLAATDGATPATLKEIVKRAVVSALGGHDPENNGQPLTLTANDLVLAAQQVRVMRDPELVPGSFGFRERGEN